MLYATVTILRATTGLYAARIVAGPRVTELRGYLSEAMARAAAEHCALAVFGRAARFS